METQPIGNTLVENLALILAILVGVWEVIARVIPTVNNWSGTALVLKVLNFLSELLNRTKK